MLSRKQLRKLEEQRVEELLKVQETPYCVFCERINQYPAAMDARYATLKPFREMPICHQCYQQLLRLHKNREYARTLNTVDAVMKDDQFAAYLRWVKKRPPETLYH